MTTVNITKSMAAAAANDLETIRATDGPAAMLTAWLSLKAQLKLSGSLLSEIETYAKQQVPTVAGVLANATNFLKVQEATVSALKRSRSQPYELMKRVLADRPETAAIADPFLAWVARHDTPVIEVVGLKPDAESGSVDIQLQIRVNWPPQTVLDAYLRTSDPQFTADAGKYTNVRVDITVAAMRAFLDGQPFAAKES